MYELMYVVVIVGLFCFCVVQKMHQYDIERERDYYKDKVNKLEIEVDILNNL